MSRRLPVYLILDTSGSMRGEPIESVNTGLETLLGALRQDPYALETIHLTVMTFDREVKTVVPMTALEDVILPRITTPDSGPTHLGEALVFSPGMQPAMCARVPRRRKGTGRQS